MSASSSKIPLAAQSDNLGKRYDVYDIATSTRAMCRLCIVSVLTVSEKCVVSVLLYFPAELSC